MVGGLAGLVILILLVWALFFRRRRAGGISHQPELGAPVMQSKTEDPEAAQQRSTTGLLARLHGHDSALTVEPLTLAERQEREAAQIDWGSKGSGPAQRRELSHNVIFPSGRESSPSRIEAPASVDPPSTLPSVSTTVSSPSASPSHMVRSSSAEMGHIDYSPVQETTPTEVAQAVRKGSGGPIRTRQGTIAEEAEDAPPAYGTTT